MCYDLQGQNVSRLPAFTEEEKTMLRGSADFFGLNFYTSALVNTSYQNDESYWTDSDVADFQSELWPS